MQLHFEYKMYVFIENFSFRKRNCFKKVFIFVNWVFHRKNRVIDTGKWQVIRCWKGIHFVQTIPSTVFMMGRFFLQISWTYLYVRVVHITLTSFDFCLICKKNPAVVFRIFFLFCMSIVQILEMCILLWFLIIYAKIYQLLNWVLFFLQNIACRVPHFPG